MAQLGTQATGISGTVVNAANTMLHNPVVQYNFAASLGNEFNAAKASGASDMDAMTAATVSGLFNAIVESGGVEALPKQLQGTDLSTAQKAWRWMISAVSEGGEEPIQGLISEMTAKAAYAANKPYFSTTDENAVVNPGRMVREFGYGTAIGGILSGVPMTSRKAVELWERSTRENGGRAQVQNILEVQQNETAPGKASGANRMLTDEDLAAYLRVGKKKSTRDKKQYMLDSGNNPILTSGEQIKSFISEAIHGKNQGQTKAYGIVGTDLAEAVRAVSPDTDISDRYLELTSDALAHAYKEHAKAKEYGDIDLTEKDFQNIPDYINNFDYILSVEPYNGKTKIRIAKKINGYSVILETISSERDSIHFLNMIGMSTKKFEKKYATKINAAGSLRRQQPQTVNTTAQHTGHGVNENTNTLISNIANSSGNVNSTNSAMSTVEPDKPSGTDEGIYTEYITQLQGAQEKVRAEELRQEYLRNLERLEEAEREAEMDAAFWKGFDR